MSVLRHEHILRLHAAAVGAGLIGDRNVLLAGIAPSLIASLPQTTNAGAQILSDLEALNAAGQLADGTTPLCLWLSNACALSAGRRESDLFREALEIANGSKARRSPSGPSYPDG